MQKSMWGHTRFYELRTILCHSGWYKTVRKYVFRSNESQKPNNFNPHIHSIWVKIDCELKLCAAVLYAYVPSSFFSQYNPKH